MKTREELSELKAQYQALTQKLQELTDDELKAVTGGAGFEFTDYPSQYEPHFYKNPVFPSKPFKMNENQKDDSADTGRE